MYGKYRHTLDAKGRLFVPSKLRDELGDYFYVAKAPDACLTVYPESEWQKLLARCNELPSSKARSMRYFFANVAKCEPDKQGRFLLPESLREYAGIDQEVMFLGQGTRAEIWSAERYEAEEAKYLTPEALAAVMEELGF
ncbi:MAG: division/cell wall cluster transcriptional repressor MraZ [Oscillospiraceae bacterium]|nr:division/cell wall cluster transcriptional repressor MraZ [Oscillospiraceae bacterium]